MSSYNLHYRKISKDAVILAYLFKTYEERIEAEMNIIESMSEYLKETNKSVDTRTLITPDNEYVMEITIRK
jgi:hypothetical protein